LAAPSAADIDRALTQLRGRRVAIALSGGVDSAVAALRLVEIGAEPVGLALRLHDPDPDNPLAPRACCPPDDLQDARRVCEQLDIPFYVLDARSEFDQAVVRPFVRAYLRGRTPNPCVGCNAFVKLDRLARRARALGCEALATGHYARIARTAAGPRLFAGVDAAKDQSYFLFSVGAATLQDLAFPLGAWTKDDVRRRAIEAGLPVGHKLESQEVCFVGGAGAGAFVRRQAESAGLPGGAIRDEAGRELGRHDGIAGFTVGQRKGIGVAARERLHVLDIDPATHDVTVGPAHRLERCRLFAERASWPRGAQPARRFEARVQIRYRDPGMPATVEVCDGGRIEVRFERPVRAVAPGQAAVFRVGEEVVGGAWISGSAP
jgi:tRNA-specific 2-thiouridylase